MYSVTSNKYDIKRCECVGLLHSADCVLIKSTEGQLNQAADRM